MSTHGGHLVLRAALPICVALSACDERTPAVWDAIIARGPDGTFVCRTYTPVPSSTWSADVRCGTHDGERWTNELVIRGTDGASGDFVAASAGEVLVRLARHTLATIRRRNGRFEADVQPLDPAWQIDTLQFTLAPDGTRHVLAHRFDRSVLLLGQAPGAPWSEEPAPAPAPATSPWWRVFPPGGPELLVGIGTASHALWVARHEATGWTSQTYADVWDVMPAVPAILDGSVHLAFSTANSRLSGVRLGRLDEGRYVELAWVADGEGTVRHFIATKEHLHVLRDDGTLLDFDRAGRELRRTPLGGTGIARTPMVWTGDGDDLDVLVVESDSMQVASRRSGSWSRSVVEQWQPWED